MEQSNKELLKKIAYLAIGVLSPENGKFSDMVDEWVDKGKMTEEEGRKFVDEVVEKGKSIKSDLEKSVLDQSKSFYKNIHLATTDQLQALEKRVKALEKNQKDS